MDLNPGYGASASDAGTEGTQAAAMAHDQPAAYTAGWVTVDATGLHLELPKPVTRMRLYRITFDAGNSYGRFPSRMITLDREAFPGERISDVLRRVQTIHADGAWYDEWSLVGYRIMYGGAK